MVRIPGVAWVALLGAVISGCLESAGVSPCGELLCPADTVCVDATSGGRCVPAAQALPCEDQPPGAACAFAGRPGTCRDAVCALIVCGDGFVEGDEVCDPGPAGDVPCNSACTSDLSCGNAKVDPGEACDCGNDGFPDERPAACAGGANRDEAGAFCRADCQLAFCGNGALELGEVCDDGPAGVNVTCNALCTSDLSCGNGVVDGVVGEACDCGVDATALPSGCATPNGAHADASCTPECAAPTCGDGLVQGEEVCDDGPAGVGVTCNAQCTSDLSCDNRIVDSIVGEACDCGADPGAVPPGCSGVNSDAPDATCRSNCRLAGCGDGIRSSFEQCEPGDLGGAACTDLGFYAGALTCGETCRYDTTTCEGRCGDGQVQAEEICDGQLTANSCLAYGYDYGLATCSGLCTPAFAACGRVGWDLIEPFDALEVHDSAFGFVLLGSDRRVYVDGLGGALAVLELPGAAPVYDLDVDGGFIVAISVAGGMFQRPVDPAGVDWIALPETPGVASEIAVSSNGVVYAVVSGLGALRLQAGGWSLEAVGATHVKVENGWVVASNGVQAWRGMPGSSLSAMLTPGYFDDLWVGADGTSWFIAGDAAQVRVGGFWSLFSLAAETGGEPARVVRDSSIFRVSWGRRLASLALAASTVEVHDFFAAVRDADFSVAELPVLLDGAGLNVRGDSFWMRSFLSGFTEPVSGTVDVDDQGGASMRLTSTAVFSVLPGQAYEFGTISEASQIANVNDGLAYVAQGPTVYACAFFEAGCTPIYTARAPVVDLDATPAGTLWIAYASVGTHPGGVVRWDSGVATETTGTLIPSAITAVDATTAIVSGVALAAPGELLTLVPIGGGVASVANGVMTLRYVQPSQVELVRAWVCDPTTVFVAGRGEVLQFPVVQGPGLTFPTRTYALPTSAEVIGLAGPGCSDAYAATGTQLFALRGDDAVPIAWPISELIVALVSDGGEIGVVTDGGFYQLVGGP